MRTIDADAALKALRKCQTYLYDARDPELKIELSSAEAAINNLPTIQPENAQLSQQGTTKDATSDLISRQEAIDRAVSIPMFGRDIKMVAVSEIKNLSPAQPEQRYTEEELRVFQHGISLSLLSKRSAQHWRYDEDTATEIKFLERLYEKVGADMRGEQNE